MIIGATIFAYELLSSSAGADTSQKHAIDISQSHATFSVTHLYLTHVTGNVPILSGMIILSPGSAAPTSVTATLDPTRINSGNGDRDGDLQGPDWFDTKRFPTWSFVSASVSSASAGSFIITGALTVHGVAQPVSLNVTTMGGAAHLTYHAIGHIDRHAFGMRVTPTDGVIGSDVEMTLEVKLK